MICLGTKFLSICGLVKLENKLFTLKIQWWYKHRRRVMHILFQLRRTKKEESPFPPNFSIQPARSIGFQGLKIVLYGLKLCPWPVAQHFRTELPSQSSELWVTLLCLFIVLLLNGYSICWFSHELMKTF